MSESTPGATPVKDRRTPPRGVIPRHMQTWLMVGLAAGILAIIVFTGHTERPQRPAAAGTQPTPPDAARTRDFQDRLRVLDERARQQQADGQRDDNERPFVGERPATQQDPIAAEKKRRDYESLFSGVRVSTQSHPDQRVTEPREALPPMNIASGSAPGPTSVDALAAMLMRAANNQAALGSRGRDPVPVPDPGPASVDPPSASPLSTPAHRLRQGVLIPVVLVNRINSSSPGPVICQVTEPVLSEDAQHVLIPAGARLLGVSKPTQGQDASVVPITFHTLQVDRHDYALDQFVALNHIGEAGLRDKVDQHYWSTFGAASMIGLLTGISQLATTSGLTGGDGDRTIVIAGATGDAASQATAQALDRFLRRPPRITVTEGHRFHVYVSRDLHLPLYSPESVVPSGTPTP